MKYSITIPAYKAKFLSECLESVLSQTYDDYEVIILNDCSPEDIKGIVEGVSSHKNGNKIRYYENEINVGAVDVVDNWNKLLELVKGDYVICMGDDDKLHPDCLRQYARMIEKYPNCDVFHVRTEIIDENSSKIALQSERKEVESAYEMLWHGICGKRVQFIGDFLYKSMTLKRKGGFYYMPLAYTSDWITCMMIGKENGIVDLNDVLFYYRSSSQTITSTGNRRLMIDAWWKYKDWILDFLKDIPSNEADRWFRSEVLNSIEFARKNSILNDIALDIKAAPLTNTVYWCKRRREYGLSITDIMCRLALGMYRTLKRGFL